MSRRNFKARSGACSMTQPQDPHLMRTGQLIRTLTLPARAALETPTFAEPIVSLPNVIRSGKMTQLFGSSGVLEVRVTDNLRAVHGFMTMAVESGIMSKGTQGNREFSFVWEESDSRVLRGAGTYVLTAYPRPETLKYKATDSTRFVQVM